jgi:hypothetical protein
MSETLVACVIVAIVGVLWIWPWIDNERRPTRLSSQHPLCCPTRTVRLFSWPAGLKCRGKPMFDSSLLAYAVLVVSLASLVYALRGE